MLVCWERIVFSVFVPMFMCPRLCANTHAHPGTYTFGNILAFVMLSRTSRDAIQIDAANKSASLYKLVLRRAHM